MANQIDRALVYYVNRLINAGHTSIDIPMSLIEGSSKDALEEVYQLCKLSGVKVGIFQD